jgi:hypothetical protein
MHLGNESFSDNISARICNAQHWEPLAPAPWTETFDLFGPDSATTGKSVQHLTCIDPLDTHD